MRELNLPAENYAEHDTTQSHILYALHLAVKDDVRQAWIAEKLVDYALDEELPFCLRQFIYAWIDNGAHELIERIQAAFATMWHDEVRDNVDEAAASDSRISDDDANNDSANEDISGRTIRQQRHTAINIRKAFEEHGLSHSHRDKKDNGEGSSTGTVRRLPVPVIDPPPLREEELADAESDEEEYEGKGKGSSSRTVRERCAEIVVLPTVEADERKGLTRTLTLRHSRGDVKSLVEITPIPPIQEETSAGGSARNCCGPVIEL
jgi:hypothetical protein